jgi:hypothetical protein
LDRAWSLDHDRGMPQSGFVSSVRAVDWAGLPSTYGWGEIVRDIVLGLASRDAADVERAWQRIGETVLQHQGTVYPATAAAAPFLCQIALDEASPGRAVLTAELAFLSTGYDQPSAPAGTAQAVRDAVRPYPGQLLGLRGTADAGLDPGLLALSVAFPAQAAPVTAHLREWFARSETPLRTALALIRGVHGLADEAAEQIIRDEVAKSVSWVSRTGEFIAFVPDDSPFPEPGQEPYINSPVPEAIQVAARLVRTVLFGPARTA